MNLRAKLLLPLLLIGALLAGYLYLGWIPRLLDEARNEHLTRIERHLDSVVEGLIPLLTAGQLDAVHDNLGALRERNGDWTDIVLIDDRQRQLYPLAIGPSPSLVADPQHVVVERRITFLDTPLGTLQVRIDLSAPLAEDRQHYNELGASLAVMLGALLATLAATLEYAVRRPVDRLAKASRALAQRNFDATLPAVSRDEVGTLVAAFDAMRHDLRQNQRDLLREVEERRRGETALTQANAELERHRSHLGELVVERTQELEARNRSLKEALDLVQQAQRELVESEKMASLGRLVAGFAHEINTPIGVAVGASSHALEVSQKLQPLLAADEIDAAVLGNALAEISEATTLVYSNLARAADLVGRFKRTSVDQTRGEARLYNLRETLTDVVASLHDVLKRTPVEVRVDCPQDIELFGAPGALGQILTNLIVNSIRHGFAQGTEAGDIVIAAARDGDEIELDYRDSGRGMDAATRARAFEPFFTMARESGGTGLGLFICHNLATAELHGSIHCESAPGAGTRFILRYPATSPVAPAV